jgi:isochorismate synthase
MTSLCISYPGTSEIKCYRAGATGTIGFSIKSFDGREGKILNVKEVNPKDFQLCPLKSTPVGDQPLHRKDYVDLINRTISHIRTKGLGKIVVSRFADEKALGDPLKAFTSLVDAYSDACVYIFTDPDLGTWLGATPEVLLQGRGNEVDAMSLAGTAVAGYEQALGDKEKLEQAMVTLFIKDAFHQAGIATVSLSAPHIRQAGNLIHFQSEVSATVPEAFDHQALVENLHPTPAVAGLPRDEALLFLQETENYNRELYTGYFGLREADNYTYFVNLRCMQIYTNSVRFYAGGGITADSDPESEWLETETKMDTLRKILQ